MIDIILQFLVTVSLILGIISGETLAIKAFGSNSKWYLNMIDIFLFVILTILLLNNIYLKEIKYFLILGINFFVGLGSILITKSVTCGFGLLGKKITNKIDKKLKVTYDILMAGLVRNLKDRGLDNKELQSLLINSGFDKKKVNYFVKNSFYTKENQEE